jgi:hypothetical protein
MADRMDSKSWDLIFDVKKIILCYEITYKLHASLDQTVPFKFLERKQLFFFTSSQTSAEDIFLVYLFS